VPLMSEEPANCRGLQASDAPATLRLGCNAPQHPITNTDCPARRPEDACRRVRASRLQATLAAGCARTTGVQGVFRQLTIP
jgi:hypothetical protein